MSNTGGQLANHAAELRVAFDQSFTLPHRTDSEKGENLLEVRIGREAFALRLSEISGLFSERKITPVPSPVTALMGVVSFRGAIMPVYNLQGFFTQPLAEPPRWLAIAAGAPIALAFHHFDGHSQVLKKDLLPREEQQMAGRYVRDFARLQTLACPIVHVPSIIDAIRAQSNDIKSTRER